MFSVFLLFFLKINSDTSVFLLNDSVLLVGFFYLFFFVVVVAVVVDMQVKDLIFFICFAYEFKKKIKSVKLW